MAILSVHHLSISLGATPIVHDVSCTITQGNIVAFLGPNGAGKTTLLKTIIGLYANPTPDAAHTKNVISFDGRVINHISTAERVRRGIVYLPQHTSLLTHLTGRQNLEIVYHYHDYWRTQSRDAFNDMVTTWLATTELDAVINRPAGSLSGGQKRKLEIVRAALMRPAIFLLDEPFAAVDPKSIYELKALFVAMADNGMGVLISDHNVDQLFSIAKHAYVMVDGRIVASGTIHDILEHGETCEMYFGHQFTKEVTQRFEHAPQKKASV